VVICHTNSREAITEFHRSVGGVVVHDTIPPEGEMRRLLQEAGLEGVVVRDEPDLYLVLARRGSSVSREGNVGPGGPPPAD